MLRHEDERLYLLRGALHRLHVLGIGGLKYRVYLNIQIRFL